MELFQSKFEEGHPMSPHVLHMIDLIEQLRQCDFPLNDTLGWSVILGSLLRSFNQFVLNFNMQGIPCSYNEQHRILQTTEEDLKKRVPNHLPKSTALSATSQSKKKGKKKKREERWSSSSSKG